MARIFKDRVAFYTATTGTGTISVGSVAAADMLLPSDAGMVTGDNCYLLIQDGQNFEISDCTYTSGAPATFSRDTVLVSKIAGVVSTTKLTLSGAAVCRLVLPAEVANRIATSLGTVSKPFAGAYFSAGSSLNWNNGAATLVESGGGLVGTGGEFHWRGATGLVQLQRYSANSSGPALFFSKSRHATVGSHTIVASGDSVGEIYFRGSDGTNFVAVAAIIANMDGTPGAGDMPGRICFYTTADNSASLVGRMIIDSTGSVKPFTHNSTSLGTGAVAWSGLHLSANAGIIFGNGNASIYSSAGTLRFNADSIQFKSSVNGAPNLIIESGRQHLAGDVIASVSFKALDSTGINVHQYAYISAHASNVTNGAEGGELAIMLSESGADRYSAVFRPGSVDAGDFTSYLGSSNGLWAGLLLANNGLIDWNGKVRISHDNTNNRLVFHNYGSPGSFNFESYVDYPNFSINSRFTPAANGLAGAINFGALDSGAGLTVFSQIHTYAADVTAGSEDGVLAFGIITGGSNQLRVRITGSELSPYATNATALGSASYQWSDLWLAALGVVNWANGEVRLFGAADTLTADGISGFKAQRTNAASGFVTFYNGVVNNAIIGSVSGNALNASSIEKLYARVLFYCNDNTNGSEDGSLYLGQVTAGTFVDRVVLNGTAFQPTSNDICALGTPSSAFSNLYLATGAIVGFGNGNVSITHATGYLLFDIGNFYFHAADGAPNNNTGNTPATALLNTGTIDTAAYQTGALYVNRLGNDGGIISIRQEGTEEGLISVAGTTVSYTGGHLARWTQWFEEEPSLLPPRGTVLSNADEMCRFFEAVFETNGRPRKKEIFGDYVGGEQITVEFEGVDYPATVVVLPNDQLNKMFISNEVGDRNIAGVVDFYDEDGVLHVAQSGDYVIRISPGIIVKRGDLLESNGNGCARPQTDDIIRSKTIAKVSSSLVSRVYEDGSYLVPCVLMAGG
jgi:hypothetical protein